MSQADSTRSRADDDAKLAAMLAKAEASADLAPLLRDMQRDGEWDLETNDPRVAASSYGKADSASGRPPSSGTPLSPGRSARSRWKEAASEVSQRTSEQQPAKRLKNAVRDAQQDEARKTTKKYKENLDLLLVKLEEAQRERDAAETEMKKLRVKSKELKGEVAQWEAKEAVFTASQQQIKQYRDRLKSADVQALAAAEDLAAARAQGSVADSRVAQLEAQLADLRTESAAASTSHALAQREADDALHDLRRVQQREGDDLRSRIGSLETRCSDLQRARSSLEDAADTSTRRADTLERELQQARNALSDAETKLLSQRTRLADLEGSATGNERRIHDSQSRLDQLQQERAELDRRLESADRAREEGLSVQQGLRAEVATLQGRIQGRDAELAALREDLATQLEASHGLLRAAEGEAAAARGQCSALAAREAALQASLQEAAAARGTARQRHRSGQRALVHRLSRVEASLMGQHDAAAAYATLVASETQRLQPEAEATVHRQLVETLRSDDDLLAFLDATARSTLQAEANERFASDTVAQADAEEAAAAAHKQDYLQQHEAALVEQAVRELKADLLADTDRRALLRDAVAEGVATDPAQSNARQQLLAEAREEAARRMVATEGDAIEREAHAALVESAKAELLQQEGAQLRQQARAECTEEAKEEVRSVEAEALADAARESLLAEAKADMTRSVESARGITDAARGQLVAEEKQLLSAAPEERRRAASVAKAELVSSEKAALMESSDERRVIREAARSEGIAEARAELESSREERRWIKERAKEELVVEEKTRVESDREGVQLVRHEARSELIAKERVALQASPLVVQEATAAARAELIEEEKQRLLVPRSSAQLEAQVPSLPEDVRQEASTQLQRDRSVVEQRLLEALQTQILKDEGDSLAEKARTEVVAQMRRDIVSNEEGQHDELVQKLEKSLQNDLMQSEGTEIMNRARDGILEAAMDEIRADDVVQKQIASEASESVTKSLVEEISRDAVLSQELRRAAEQRIVDTLLASPGDEEELRSTALQLAAAEVGRRDSDALVLEARAQLLQASLEELTEDAEAMARLRDDAHTAVLAEEKARCLRDHQDTIMQQALKAAVTEEQQELTGTPLVHEAAKERALQQCLQEGGTHLVETARAAALQSLIDGMKRTPELAQAASDALLYQVMSEQAKDEGVMASLRRRAEDETYKALLLQEKESLLRTAQEKVAATEGQLLYDEARCMLMQTLLDELKASGDANAKLRDEAKAAMMQELRADTTLQAAAREAAFDTLAKNVASDPDAMTRLEQRLVAALTDAVRPADSPGLQDDPAFLEGLAASIAERIVGAGHAAPTDTPHKTFASAHPDTPSFEDRITAHILNEARQSRQSPERSAPGTVLLRQAEQRAFDELCSQARQDPALLRRVTDRVEAELVEQQGAAICAEARDRLVESVLHGMQERGDGEAVARDCTDAAAPQDRDGLIRSIIAKHMPHPPAAQPKPEVPDAEAQKRATEAAVAEQEGGVLYAEAREQLLRSLVGSLSAADHASLREEAKGRVIQSHLEDPALLGPLRAEVAADIRRTLYTETCSQAASPLSPMYSPRAESTPVSPAVYLHDTIASFRTRMQEREEERVATRGQSPEPSAVDHLEGDVRDSLRKVVEEEVAQREAELLCMDARAALLQEITDTMRDDPVAYEGIRRVVQAQLEAEEVRRQAAAQDLVLSDPTELCAEARDMLLQETLGLLKVDLSQLAEVEREAAEEVRRNVVARANAVAEAEGASICAAARQALLEQATAELQSNPAACAALEREVHDEAKSLIKKTEDEAADTIARSDAPTLYAEARQALYNETLGALREDAAQMENLQKSVEADIRAEVREREAARINEAEATDLCAEARQSLYDETLAALRGDDVQMKALRGEVTEKVQREQAEQERQAAEEAGRDAATLQAKAHQALYDEILAALREDAVQMKNLQQSVEADIRAEVREREAARINEAEATDLCAEARQSLCDETLAALRSDDVQMEALRGEVLDEAKAVLKEAENEAADTVARSDAPALYAEARQALYDETVAALRGDDVQMEALRSEVAAELQKELAEQERQAAEEAGRDAPTLQAKAHQALYDEILAALREDVAQMENLQKSVEADIRAEVREREAARINEAEAIDLCAEARQSLYDETLAALRGDDVQMNALTQEVRTEVKSLIKKAEDEAADTVARSDAPTLYAEARQSLYDETVAALRGDDAQMENLQKSVESDLRAEVREREAARINEAEAIDLCAEARQSLYDETLAALRGDDAQMEALRGEVAAEVQKELAEQERQAAEEAGRDAATLQAKAHQALYDEILAALREDAVQMKNLQQSVEADIRAEVREREAARINEAEATDLCAEARQSLCDETLAALRSDDVQMEALRGEVLDEAKAVLKEAENEAADTVARSDAPALYAEARQALYDETVAALRGDDVQMEALRSEVAAELQKELAEQERQAAEEAGRDAPTLQAKAHQALYDEILAALRENAAQMENLQKSVEADIRAEVREREALRIAEAEAIDLCAEARQALYDETLAALRGDDVQMEALRSEARVGVQKELAECDRGTAADQMKPSSPERPSELLHTPPSDQRTIEQHHSHTSEAADPPTICSPVSTYAERSPLHVPAAPCAAALQTRELQQDTVAEEEAALICVEARQALYDGILAALREDAAQMQNLQQSVEADIRAEVREREAVRIAEAEAIDLCAEARQSLYDETLAALRSDAAQMEVLRGEAAAEVVERERCIANDTAEADRAAGMRDEARPLVKTATALCDDEDHVKQIRAEAEATIRDEVAQHHEQDIATARAQAVAEHLAALMDDPMQRAELQSYAAEEARRAVLSEAFATLRDDASQLAEIEQIAVQAVTDELQQQHRDALAAGPATPSSAGKAAAARHTEAAEATPPLTDSEGPEPLMSDARTKLLQELVRGMREDEAVYADLQREAVAELKAAAAAEELQAGTHEAAVAEVLASLVQQIRADPEAMSRLHLEALHKVQDSVLAEEAPLLVQSAREQLLHSLTHELRTADAPHSSPAEPAAGADQHATIRSDESRARPPLTEQERSAMVEEFVQAIRNDPDEMGKLATSVAEKAREPSPGAHDGGAQRALLAELNAAIHEEEEEEPPQPATLEQEVDAVMGVAQARVMQELEAELTSQSALRTGHATGTADEPQLPTQSPPVLSLGPDAAAELVDALYRDLVSGAASAVRCNDALRSRLQEESAELCALQARLPPADGLCSEAKVVEAEPLPQLVSRAEQAIRSDAARLSVLSSVARDVGPLPAGSLQPACSGSRRQIASVAAEAVQGTAAATENELRLAAQGAAMRELSSDAAVSAVLRDAVQACLVDCVHEGLDQTGTLDERIARTAQLLVLQQLRQHATGQQLPPADAARIFEAAGESAMGAQRRRQSAKLAGKEVRGAVRDIATKATEVLIEALVEEVQQAGPTHNEARQAFLSLEGVRRIQRDVVSALSWGRGASGTPEADERLVEEISGRLQGHTATMRTIREAANAQAHHAAERRLCQQVLQEEAVALACEAYLAGRESRSDAVSLHIVPASLTIATATVRALPAACHGELATEVYSRLLGVPERAVPASDLEGYTDMLMWRAQQRLVDAAAEGCTASSAALCGRACPQAALVSVQGATPAAVERAVERLDESTRPAALQPVVMSVADAVAGQLTQALVQQVKADADLLRELQAASGASRSAEPASVAKIRSDTLAAMQWSRQARIPEGASQGMVDEMAARIREDPAAVQALREAAREQIRQDTQRDTWKREARAKAARSVAAAAHGVPLDSSEEARLQAEEAALAELAANHRQTMAAEARCIVLADLKAEAALSAEDSLAGQVESLLRRAQDTVEAEVRAELERDGTLVADMRAQVAPPEQDPVLEKIQALGTVAAARVDDDIAARREEEPKLAAAEKTATIVDEESKLVDELVTTLRNDEAAMEELRAQAQVQMYAVEAATAEACRAPEVTGVGKRHQHQWQQGTDKEACVEQLVKAIEGDAAALAAIASAAELVGTSVDKRPQDSQAARTDTLEQLPAAQAADTECLITAAQSKVVEALTQEQEHGQAQPPAGDEVLDAAVRRVVQRMQQENTDVPHSNPTAARERAAAVFESVAQRVEAGLQEVATPAVPPPAADDTHTHDIATDVHRLVVHELISSMRGDARLMDDLRAQAEHEELHTAAMTETDLHVALRCSTASRLGTEAGLSAGEERQLVDDMAARFREDPAAVQALREAACEQIRQDTQRDTWKREARAKAAHTIAAAHGPLDTTEEARLQAEEAALAELAANHRQTMAAEARCIVLADLKAEAALSAEDSLAGQVESLLRRAQDTVEAEVRAELERDGTLVADMRAQVAPPEQDPVLEKLQALGTVAAARVDDDIAARREEEAKLAAAEKTATVMVTGAESKLVDELVTTLRNDEAAMEELRTAATAQNDHRAEPASVVKIRSDTLAAMQWSRQARIPEGASQGMVDEMAARIREDPAAVQALREAAREQIRQDTQRDTWKREARAKAARSVAAAAHGVPLDSSEEARLQAEEAALAELAANHRQTMAAEARCIVLADLKAEAALSAEDSLAGQVESLLRRAQDTVEAEVRAELERDGTLPPTRDSPPPAADAPNLEAVGVAETCLRRALEEEIRTTPTVMAALHAEAREAAQRGPPPGIEAARHIARESVRQGPTDSDPETRAVVTAARSDDDAMHAIHLLAAHEAREESLRQAGIPQMPFSSMQAVSEALVFSASGQITADTRRRANEASVKEVSSQDALLLAAAKQGVVNELVAEIRRDNFRNEPAGTVAAAIDSARLQLVHEAKGSAEQCIVLPTPETPGLGTTARDSAASRGLSDVQATAHGRLQRRAAEWDVPRGTGCPDAAQEEGRGILAGVAETYVNLMAEGMKSEEAVMEQLQAKARAVVNTEIDLASRFSRATEVAAAGRVLRCRRGSMHSTPGTPRTPALGQAETAPCSPLKRMQEAIQADERSMSLLHAKAASAAAEAAEAASVHAVVAQNPGVSLQRVLAELSDASGSRLFDAAYSSVLEDVSASLEDPLPSASPADIEAERLLLAAQATIIAELCESPELLQGVPRPARLPAEDVTALKQRAVATAGRTLGTEAGGTAQADTPEGIVQAVRSAMVSEVAAGMRADAGIAREIDASAAQAVRSQAQARRRSATLPSYGLIWERAAERVLRADAPPAGGGGSLLPEVKRDLRGDPLVMQALTQTAREMLLLEQRRAAPPVPCDADAVDSARRELESDGNARRARARAASVLRLSQQEALVGEAEALLFRRAVEELTQRSTQQEAPHGGPPASAAEAEANALLEEAQREIIDELRAELRAAPPAPTASRSEALLADAARRMSEGQPAAAAGGPPPPAVPAGGGGGPAEILQASRQAFAAEVDRALRADPAAMEWLAAEAAKEAAEEAEHAALLGDICRGLPAEAAGDADAVADAMRKNSVVMGRILEDAKGDILRARRRGSDECEAQVTAAMEDGSGAAPAQAAVSAVSAPLTAQVCEGIIAGVKATRSPPPAKPPAAAAAEAQLRAQLRAMMADSHIPDNRCTSAAVAAAVVAAEGATLEAVGGGPASAAAGAVAAVVAPEPQPEPQPPRSASQPRARSEEEPRVSRSPPVDIPTVAAARESAIRFLQSKCTMTDHSGTASTTTSMPREPAAAAIPLAAVSRLFGAHSALLRDFFVSCEGVLVDALCTYAFTRRPGSEASDDACGDPGLELAEAGPLVPIYDPSLRPSPSMAVHCGCEEQYAVADECDLSLGAQESHADECRSLGLSMRSPSPAQPLPLPLSLPALSETTPPRSVLPQDNPLDDLRMSPRCSSEFPSCVSVSSNSPQSRWTSPTRPSPSGCDDGESLITDDTAPPEPQREIDAVVTGIDFEWFEALPHDSRLAIEAAVLEDVCDGVSQQPLARGLLSSDITEALWISDVSAGSLRAAIRCADGPRGSCVFRALQAALPTLQYPKTLRLVHSLRHTPAEQPDLTELEADMEGLLQATEQLLAKASTTASLLSTPCLSSAVTEAHTPPIAPASDVPGAARPSGHPRGLGVGQVAPGAASLHLRRPRARTHVAEASRDTQGGGAVQGGRGVPSTVDVGVGSQTDAAVELSASVGTWTEPDTPEHCDAATETPRGMALQVGGGGGEVWGARRGGRAQGAPTAPATPGTASPRSKSGSPARSARQSPTRATAATAATSSMSPRRGAGLSPVEAQRRAARRVAAALRSKRSQSASRVLRVQDSGSPRPSRSAERRSVTTSPGRSPRVPSLSLSPGARAAPDSGGPRLVLTPHSRAAFPAHTHSGAAQQPEGAKVMSECRAHTLRVGQQLERVVASARAQVPAVAAAAPAGRAQVGHSPASAPLPTPPSRHRMSPTWIPPPGLAHPRRAEPPAPSTFL